MRFISNITRRMIFLSPAKKKIVMKIGIMSIEQKQKFSVYGDTAN